MDDSQNNINLYPERRQNRTPARNQYDREEKGTLNETSRYFEPFKQKEKQHRPDEKGDDDWVNRCRSGRQTLLDFSSSGQLTTKMPLVNPIARSNSRRMALADVASETISLLPGLLATRPDVGTAGELFERQDVNPLSPNFGPKLPSTRVRVINSDTIDAALDLMQRTPGGRPVCVLNMANAAHAGGGFKHGALAQEEALCYRSSLFFTLKIKHYPIPDKAAIYSPKVLIFRESMKDGHDLMDLRSPASLPVISVVSTAAICQPRLASSAQGLKSYANVSDKDLMMQKMRVILRVANRNRHKRLVLGAFGCGAFANPPHEVAQMWSDVLQESEFQAGWWEGLVFAVIDTAGSDNFKMFKYALDGLDV
jgi:uncharacterized protein (TIGR02452 family)